MRHQAVSRRWSRAIALRTPRRMDAMPGRGRARSPTAELFVFGLQGASGSTIGPDGALYVTEGAVGRISRVDLQTGAVDDVRQRTPELDHRHRRRIDVAFIGTTAYALVTLVGADVLGSADVGIYRVNGPNHDVIADIGEFARNNPPQTPFDLRQRTAVRHGGLPRRVPGDRRPSQSRASSLARRHGQRSDRVRQHRSDRSGSAWRRGPRGSGRPRSSPARGRQDRRVQPEAAVREGDRLGAPVSSSTSNSVGNGGSTAFRRECSRAANPPAHRRFQHRCARPGQQTRRLRRCRGRSEPADVG